MDRHEEFLRLFLRYEADVRAFIRSVVRDRHLSEDLLQEVALTLWQRYDSYDRARPFGAWARGIAAYKVLQSHEKRRRLPAALSSEAIEAVREGFDRLETDSSSERDALEECVERLPANARRLLALRYRESLELKQLAEAVQSTLDAVHKALSRIRAALRKCVEARLAARQAR